VLFVTRRLVLLSFPVETSLHEVLSARFLSSAQVVTVVVPAVSVGVLEEHFGRLGTAGEQRILVFETVRADIDIAASLAL